MTLRQKWDNYWYHYKLHTIAGAVAALLIAVGLRSCISREMTDFHMVYMSDRYFLDSASQALEESLLDNGLVEDIDGDGKVRLYIDPLLLSFDVDSATDQMTAQKLQTVLFAGQHTLVLAHEYALEDYDGCFEDIGQSASESDKVFESPTEGFVTGISVEDNEYLESIGIDTANLYVAMRRRTQKEIEKGQNTEYFRCAQKVMDFVLSHNKKQ